MAAWAPAMFGNIYIVKSYKIANNSVTTDARVKISAGLEFLEIKINFDVRLTKFEIYQVLLNKFSHRFLVTTKLFKLCLHWQSLERYHTQ